VSKKKMPESLAMSVARKDIASGNGDGPGDQVDAELQSPCVPGLVAQIQELHVMRETSLRMILRIDNNCRAYARRLLGFQTTLPEKEREAIRKAAEAAISALVEGVECSEPRITHALKPLVEASQLARVPYVRIESSCMKDMAKLAALLPAAEFVRRTRGFGFPGYAQTIGEAGELSKYGNPGKLWKRMGLAVFDGKSQRKVTGDAAIEQGYCPRRRSIMWRIGDSMIKGNKDGYRTLYDERKAMEVVRSPEMTKMHAHRRAQRYMEKRLLKDLWREWRGQGLSEPHGTSAAPPAIATL